MGATAGLKIELGDYAIRCDAADLIPADERPDVVFADFEAETYGEWKAEGEAFGPGPAKGTLPNQMAVEGFAGKGLVNTFFKGDGTTGKLTSPEFKVERKFVRFLIGGGGTRGRRVLTW